MVKTIDHKLLRDLRSMWAQVSTIALIVGCGIAAFIGSLSTYESIKLSRDNYYQSARFADVFSGVTRAPQRLLDQIRKIDDVAQVQTRLQFTAQVDLPGVRQPLTGAVIGLDLSQPRGALNQVSLRRGTWPTRGQAEVVVHETFAIKRALNPGDKVKILLNGRIQELTIVGIALSPEFIFAAAAFGSMDETSFGVFWIDQV
ncbi:MAG: ABC transporter permease, partial [Burkholderiaceae bacterium]